jgi:hypothetical protein
VVVAPVMGAALRTRDRSGLLECARPRRRRPEVGCDTPICQLTGDRLVIRCRNCGGSHVFVVQDGQIVPEPPSVRTHCTTPTVSLRSE